MPVYDPLNTNRMLDATIGRVQESKRIGLYGENMRGDRLYQQGMLDLQNRGMGMEEEKFALQKQQMNDPVMRLGKAFDYLAKSKKIGIPVEKALESLKTQPDFLDILSDVKPEDVQFSKDGFGKMTVRNPETGEYMGEVFQDDTGKIHKFEWDVRKIKPTEKKEKEGLTAEFLINQRNDLIKNKKIVDATNLQMQNLLTEQGIKLEAGGIKQQHEGMDKAIQTIDNILKSLHPEEYEAMQGAEDAETGTGTATSQTDPTKYFLNKKYK